MRDMQQYVHGITYGMLTTMLSSDLEQQFQFVNVHIIFFTV